MFPAAIAGLARRALGEGSMPRPGGPPRRARTEQRAAFLYLRTEQPDAPWTLPLKRQFDRLFRPPWATTEQGRSLAELMAQLGLHIGDARDREAMGELLRGAGVEGGG